MNTLHLTMIVKDAADVIDRTLDSALPWCEGATIVDTGSSDGTIGKALLAGDRHGMSVRVFQEPFENFSQARNTALDHAHGQGDYLLLLDADHELVVDEPDTFDRLDGEAAMVRQHYAGIVYDNVRLLRSDSSARFVGRVHEYLDVPRSATPLPGVSIRDHSTGERYDPNKYERYLAWLEQDLADGINPHRTTFYLAQTLRDLGRYDEARDAYWRRWAMGGWVEEAWYALYQAAVCSERLGASPYDVIGQYLWAHQQRPHRPEPLRRAADYARRVGMTELAATLLGRAAVCDPGGDVLFIEEAA